MNRKRLQIALSTFAVLMNTFGLRSAFAQSAREGALIDITGQWVSVVNED